MPKLNKKATIKTEPKEVVKEEIKVKPTARIEKKLFGIALSDSKDKTVKIRVDRIKVNGIYHKRLVLSKKYLAHTEKEVKKGEIVAIVPCRPISKNKAYQIV